MHADEIETDDVLVRRLLAAQFPQWAELPIEALPVGGTDNAIYRLGDELSVRLLRRRDWVIGSLDDEFESATVAHDPACGLDGHTSTLARGLEHGHGRVVAADGTHGTAALGSRSAEEDSGMPRRDAPPLSRG